MGKTDEALMADYLGGDEAAFGELFRRHAETLVRFFIRRGKRASDAHDLLQGTFLHVHRARHDYRAGEPLRPWLFTIARNLCHDHGRRQQRRPEQYGDLDLYPATRIEPLVNMVCAERARSLNEALARLSDPDRQLVDEHWFEERSFAEIGARDGTPSSTLRVRAHRACAKLRQWLPEAYAAVAQH